MPFRKDKWVTKPHKHNSYLEIILLTAGSGTHTINQVVHTIEPPVVHVVAQEQEYCWHITSEPEGFVLLIKPTILQKTQDAKFCQLMQQYATVSACRLQDPEFAVELFALLIEDLQTQPNALSPLHEGFLKALLSIWLPPDMYMVKTNIGAGAIFSGLQHLLYEQNVFVKNVAYYAQQLHTTPQHFNYVCRKNAGASAAMVIAQAVIAQAQRLHWFSRLTMAHVALQLQFTEASHLSKYFKRHKGQTPQAWRQNANSLAIG